MSRHGCLLLLLGLAGIARAQLLPEPRPGQDDADLHDVALVGETGWVVGDCGTIWKTTNAGLTWRLVPSGVTCPLRSVYFLDESHGWAAGGEIGPYAARPEGTLLVTRDGGESWQAMEARTAPEAAKPGTSAGRKPLDRLSAGPTQRGAEAGRITFPRLHYVRFFTPTHGVLAGDPDDKHRSGVLSTSNGGLTWDEVAGAAIGNWRGADFQAPGQGAVVGLRGSVGLLVDGQLVPARNAVAGLPGMTGISLTGGGSAWLVGDGGLLMHSTNAAASWEDPPRPLPEAAALMFDFKTVCARGPKVWIAGHPGSVVWHSPDDGRTWHRHSTGQPLPICRLRMFSDSVGFAVGAMGTILHTGDGGRSWETVRGEHRRLAMLAIHGRSDRISWELLTALAGEEGYRSRVHVLSRRDIGADGLAASDSDMRLTEAAVAAGAGGVSVDWQYPQTVPGLDVDYEKLVRDWDLRSEGRLKEVLLSQLVRDLRAWRPSVVLVDRPTDRDALASLIHELISPAIQQAADSTRHVDQLRFGSLETWTVERLAVRLPDGEQGPISLEPFRFLPRLNQALSMASEPALARTVDVASRDSGLRQSFQAVGHPDAKDLFAGMVLLPGTEARRPLSPISEENLAAGQKRAERQRNFNAYVKKALGDPRHAGQLVAQIEDITREMPPREAARQLASLAEAHLNEGQWELAELQLIELVERYPDEPVAQRAALRLVQFWTGAETTWRRVRRSEINHRQARFKPDAAEEAVQQALSRFDERAAESDRSPVPLNVGESTPETVRPASADLPGATERIFAKSKFRFWREQALRVSKNLELRNASLLQTAGPQFSLAALHRGRGDAGKSAEVYRRFFQDASHPWFLAAAGELWLLQPRTVPDRISGVCRYSPQRPVLDGVLSDVCWQDATELPLTSSPGEPIDPDHSFAMLAYDSRYLYLCGRLPRAEGVRDDRPVGAGRKRDEDLSDFDRLTILLDTDRDYATHFRLTVDQRGRTAEDCWSDRSWNPQWFVAADADETHWRFEAAILLDELVPRIPIHGEAWNVAVVRTIPSVGLQAWSHPATQEPRLEASGLIKFER